MSTNPVVDVTSFPGTELGFCGVEAHPQPLTSRHVFVTGATGLQHSDYSIVIIRKTKYYRNNEVGIMQSVYLEGYQEHTSTSFCVAA